MQAVTSIVRAGIVVLWVVLVVLLIRDRRAERPVPQDLRAAADAAGDPLAESWMGVYMQNRKIGYTSHRFVPTAGGYRFEERSMLRLTVMDSLQTVHVEVGGTVDGNFALRSFSASMRSGVGDLAARGTVEGGNLVVTFKMGPEESVQSFPLSEPIYLPTGVRTYLSRGRLEAGKHLTVQVFDPATMQYQPMRVTVEDRDRIEAGSGPVEVWRVREEFHGMSTTIWLDESGRVLREEGPLNLVAVRETAEQATTAGWTGDTALDVMSVVAVPVRGSIRDARQSARLELRLDGIPDVAIPTGTRQRVNGRHVVIEREAVTPANTFALPYAGGEWAADLGATTFLQVGHPRIREAANEAVGGETDAYRAVQRLREWVFRRLKKVPTASVPNALQVLQMGQGDCNEHAVLFAALARAAGIPTRVVAGAVYLDGAFLYHAWNEVWLGHDWVSLDPTFDQMPADATHLKLIEGGPESHDSILRVVGRLSVRVLGSG